MAEPFDPYYQWLGIPPEEQPPNHYRLLGIKWFEDNADVISAAVDRQMLHLRTYQIGDYSDVSQRLLNEVISAKLCLLDPKRKAAYDQWLLEGDLEKSIETQKASKTADFGPQLESLFDEAERAEPGELLHVPRKRRLKSSRRLVMMLFALGFGLLLVLAMVTAASWLVENVAARLDGGSEPAPAANGAPQADQTQNGELNNNAPMAEEPSVAKAPAGGTEKTDNGAAKTQPAQKSGPSDATRPVAPEEKGTSAGGLDVNRRLAVPTPDERQRARQHLEEQYRLSENRTLIGKTRLAKQLLRSKRRPGIGPDATALRYEMLEQAARLAAESGNYALSMAAINEIGSRFEIDVLDAKQDCLIEAAAAARGPAKLQLLSIAADRLVDEAMEQKRPDVAVRIIEIMLRACQRPGGKEFRKTFIERRKDIRNRQKRQEETEAAENTLKTSPDDGPANLLLGKHYCFAVGDWQRGLPFLAKGNDEGLARTAKLELAKIDIDSLPLTADDEIELADAWWKLATTKPGPLKKPSLLRAAYWYGQSQTKLADGQQIRHVAKRLETIRRLVGPKDNITNKP